ncbi:LPXTG cell wall anchor domain-containing protein [Bifidobacterium apousia]|uniref:LPXTG cell wall anchor domain-containing protein n=1 Tax=Bifidobacterium apousia TaxID=2750996 RepID=UPI0018DDA857|nr:LPXTG cell wall anchor domain-containing protein [Bifidobacterium apousia]
MVRFKRACAVLAAGATLAGGLALLPTVAQAVESKNVQTKATSYQITFHDPYGPRGDEGQETTTTLNTNTSGKLDPTTIPKPTLPDQNTKADGWSLNGSGGPADDPNSQKIDFNTYVFTQDEDLYPNFVQINPITYNITFVTINPEHIEESTANVMQTNGEGKLSEEPTVRNFDGYTFDGWFNENGGSRYVPGGTYNADTIFRARYTKVTTPNEPNKPGQTAPVDNNTKQPAKDNKAPAKDPAKKDAKNNNTLAQTGADAVAPLAIAAGLCLAAGITLGLRRKLAL